MYTYRMEKKKTPGARQRASKGKYVLEYSIKAFIDNRLPGRLCTVLWTEMFRKFGLGAGNF